ncbi:DUF808 domain-containing protein [Sphingomonas lacunae]|uniref:DUF808 domain-containing protein n=1 Tax=Sphingomonas lacunae TaxID=2698828 RepID=A0A6M4AYL7_9SPHN|nr:DUF808 domain-containing protein [Sphingomonas lacunae]QJQ33450.1 DUF808 domain-containing protein [Sphingomonas lacunae]
MPTGLVALLDDIAGITKMAAASLDDVTAAAGKAGSKAMGVVVDDAAVTPRYVTDFHPDRELPIIWRIAMGSLRNKIIILLPAALLLSAFLPWLITPLLMLGGAFLCFEGAEKILHALAGDHAEEEVPMFDEPAEVEQAKVAGAIRTDFILSAEIMAIALNDVADKPIWEQGVVLAIVGVAITVLVYGVVALIVKMDDIGLVLAQRSTAMVRMIGRGLVKGMPIIMRTLAIVGTAAMLWVGGQIIVHGLETFHISEPAHSFHAAAHWVAGMTGPLGGLFDWLVNATLAGIFGLVIGAIIAFVVTRIANARNGSAAGGKAA